MESVFYAKQKLKKISDLDSKVLYLLFKHSAKLYNEALYLINKNFEKDNKYTTYVDVDNYLNHCKDNFQSKNYELLGSSLSLSIIRNLDINFKNFFSNRKKEGNLERPTFRDKNFFISIFKSIYSVKDNFITIPLTRKFRETYNIPSDYKLQFYISKNFQKLSFNQIRISQFNDNNYYLVYHYKKDIIEKKENNNNYLSIDFGVDNLLSCYPYIHEQNDLTPFIIKGGTIKFINHKNFLYSKMQYERNNNNFNSEKISKHLQKRNNQIEDYFNKCLKYIINYCEFYNINTIVCGFFKNIKLKLVAKSFFYIPYLKLRRKFRDYCLKSGINVYFINESYTSKTSFYDYESATKSDDYAGSRVKRGLFKTKEGLRINADINGAAQILTKFINFKINDRENILKNPIILKIS